MAGLMGLLGNLFQGGVTGAQNAAMMSNRYEPSRQEDLYTNALLKLALEEEERRYKEHWARQNAETVKAQLYGDEGMLRDPMLDPRTKMALQLGGAQAVSGNPFTLESALNMLEHSQQYLAQGGVPTDKMQEYELAQRDPNFGNWVSFQRQGSTPAGIQYADRITELRQQGKNEEADRLEQIVNPRNPDLTRDVAANKAMGEDEAKLIVQRLGEFPTVVSGYQNVLDSTERMKSTIDRMNKLMEDNPSAVGTLGTVFKYLPETDAKTWATEAQSLKSGLAMQSLQHLKTLSPTGASGFGALSEGELRVIQDHIARVEQSADPVAIKQSLTIIRDTLQAMQDKAKSSYVRDIDWMDKNKKYAPDLYENPKPLESTQSRESAADTFQKNRESITEPPRVRKKWSDL